MISMASNSESSNLPLETLTTTTDGTGPYFHNLEGRGLNALYISRQRSEDKSRGDGSPSYAVIIDAETAPERIHRMSFSDIQTSLFRREMEREIGPRIKARLILLAYSHPYSVQHDFVETIGARFGIDAHFFNRNLGYGFGSFLRLQAAMRKEPTMPLPSHTGSFELRWSSWRGRSIALSAMLLSPDNSLYRGDCKIGESEGNITCIC
jgi:hypothetical protein